MQASLWKWEATVSSFRYGGAGVNVADTRAVRLPRPEEAVSLAHGIFSGRIVSLDRRNEQRNLHTCPGCFVDLVTTERIC